MSTKKKDPLAKLRKKLSVGQKGGGKIKAKHHWNHLKGRIELGSSIRAKMKKADRRSSTEQKVLIKANRDKIFGKPGLYRSCRPVHAFDSDATISVTRSWGSSTCSPGDFIIVGEPKASTNWHNDIYVSYIFMILFIDSIYYNYNIVFWLFFFHLFFLTIDTTEKRIFG